VVQDKSKRLMLVAVSLLLVVAVSLSAVAQEEAVQVRARVSGQIFLTIWAGNMINFDVDPISMPEATDRTELSVMTNAKRYSITGHFGKFKINGYDLIESQKFFIQSIAPGTGQGISGWTSPDNRMTILEDEDGMTDGETTVVEYLLRVDFSVPAGEGDLEIVYTAVAAF